MQLNLVNSNRLASLRQQASQATVPVPSKKPANPSEDAETTRLRGLIEQRLSEIVRHLPTGKQSSLFKIRYGVTLEQFAQLPVKEAAELLKIGKNKR